jgi:hypothetical protein
MAKNCLGQRHEASSHARTIAERGQISTAQRAAPLDQRDRSARRCARSSSARPSQGYQMIGKQSTPTCHIAKTLRQWRSLSPLTFTTSTRRPSKSP